MFQTQHKVGQAARAMAEGAEQPELRGVKTSSHQYLRAKSAIASMLGCCVGEETHDKLTERSDRSRQLTGRLFRFLRN